MEQGQAPKESRTDDLTKEELIVLSVLTAALLVGIAAKWTIDHRWWNGEVKLIKGRAEIHYRININEADWQELMLLKGIGETKAKGIVEYRKEHGRFEKIGELADVEGISPSMVADIAELITVGEEEQGAAASRTDKR